MSNVHVKLLRKARLLIANKHYRHICIALINLTVHDSKEHVAVRDICKLIRLDMRLGNRAHSYEYWLKVVHGIFDCSKTSLRKARLAWIDALIVYWKDK